MSVLAHLRHLLARSPWIYWAVVAALALVAGIAMSRATSGVEAAKREWGELRPVVVVTADVAAGAVLDGAVRAAEAPAPLVPPSAIEELADGATARHDLAAGEIVVAGDVSSTGGPQALIPSGWLAVPVAEAVASGARPGDQVQVASGGIVLADDAVVVASADGVTLVAVPAASAAQVAQAASDADAVLLVAP
jgi:hypothetical protein